MQKVRIIVFTYTVVCSKAFQICCSALLALEWSWALDEVVCEMPEELHPTHDMIVKWVRLRSCEFGGG